MLRVMAQIICISLVGSCATKTAPEYRQEIDALTDMSIEYIQSKWGDPEYKLPKSSGTSIKYKNVAVVDEDPVTGAMAKRVCTIDLKVSGEGIVTEWDYFQCSDMRPISD